MHRVAVSYTERPCTHGNLIAPNRAKHAYQFISYHQAYALPALSIFAGRLGPIFGPAAVNTTIDSAIDGQFGRLGSGVLLGLTNYRGYR